MPPYREKDNMSTQSIQPGTLSINNDQQALDTTIEDQNNLRRGGVGSNTNNLNRRQSSRASPITRRHRRDSNSSSSASTSSSRSNSKGHITNINKINVINNFGMDTRRNRSSGKEGLSWIILRIVLALLIAVWFAAMISVLKSSPSSPTSPQSAQSKAAMSLSATKKLSDLKLGSVRGKVDSAKKVEEDKQQQPPASIFELSLFGNKSPTDFQLYTPHAPTCSQPLDAKSVSYTLVSQLSNDRVWMVQYHCERWGDNPISIAVFTDRSADEIKSELVSLGCSEQNLTVQTVSKTRYDPSGKEYPVNLLRNLAFSAVKTSHITYADIDFWPASDLHSILSDENTKERLSSDSKLATVLPVFQMNRRCKEYKDCRSLNIPQMPKDKGELINLIREKAASTFDPTNVGGHGSTKYITWRDQKTGTFVDLPCIKSNRYEPYLTVRYCSDLPPFQEGFTGYGKNKMTWVMQLRRAGYLFSQLGGAFLVHYPHLDSKSRLEWNKKPTAMEKYHKSASELLDNAMKYHSIDWGSFKRARVDALFLDFKEWLDGTVEEEPRVLMCEDALNDDVRLWVHPDKGETDDTENGNLDEDTDDEEQNAEEDIELDEEGAAVDSEELDEETEEAEGDENIIVQSTE